MPRAKLAQSLGIQHRIDVGDHGIDPQAAVIAGMVLQHAQQLLRREIVGLTGLRHEVHRDHDRRPSRRDGVSQFAQQQMRE